MQDRQGEQTPRVLETSPDKSVPEIVKDVRSLLDPTRRRLLVWNAAQILLAAAVIPVLCVLPGTIGGIFAIGVRAAITQDVRIWVRALLIGPFLIIGLLGAIYVLEALAWCTGAGLRLVFRQFSDKTRKFASRSANRVAGLAIAGGIIYSCGREGYEVALKQTPPPVTDADQKTIAETQEAAAKQGLAIKKFSATANALLNDLDRTALKVAETKREISHTMVLFDSQLAATQAAQANLSKLAEKQRDIQGRSEELERILNGKTPITQENLDRSGHDALWQGGLIGVLASLIAAYIFPQLGRLMAIITRRKRPEVDSDGNQAQ